MDNRYGRPYDGRMGQNHPGPEKKVPARPECGVGTGRNPQTAAGGRMKTRTAVKDGGYIKKNIPGPRMADNILRKESRSPYLANDMEDARQVRRMDDNRNVRFYGNGQEEMRNKCLEKNRGPQRSEDYLGWKNRGPQKSESNMGTMGTPSKSAQFMGGMNRTPRKNEESFRTGRGPQKTEHTGMGERGRQGFENAGMKNFCDYKSRRATVRGDKKR